MRLKNFALPLFICLTALFLAASANAAPVRYCLTGVVFNDGATANGCFSFDAVTGVFSGIAITTTVTPGGPPRASAFYSVVSNGFPPSANGVLFVTSTAANQTGLPGFALFFTPNLGTPGFTTFDLVAGGSQEADCGDAGCTFPAGVMRFLVAGAVVPVLGSLGEYQLRYLANLQTADSYINATNAGTFDGFDPNGRICANFYVFDPREELVSCCSCLITPNGLVSLSARNDLINNTLTGAPLTSGITVKVLANLPTPVGGTTCSPSSPTAANLVSGLKLWAVTPHGNTGLVPPPPAASAFSLTETEFTRSELSANELSKLTGFCRFIQVVASNFGICRSCPTVGAQGAAVK